MKTIKLQEASSLTAYDKMRLFDQGQRNENLKACGVPKLITFYHTCLNNGFKNAEKQVAAEVTRRNLSIYLWPDITKIDSTQFTPYEAQLLLKCKNDPERAWRKAKYQRSSYFKVGKRHLGARPCNNQKNCRHLRRARIFNY